MKLKDATGWFAAGPRMLRALTLLSDGAFRLFVYLAMTADRRTGRLQTSHARLARAVGKSRNSIAAYLDELSRNGVCLCLPATNQHQRGAIEIADPYWPYDKQSPDEEPALETLYVDQVRAWFLEYPLVRSSFGSADQALATEWFRQSVPLDHLERALLLGLARKYASSLGSLSLTPISSLSYFIPLLEEVAQTESPDRYWAYLRRRVQDLNAAWLERFQPDRSPNRPTRLLSDSLPFNDRP